MPGFDRFNKRWADSGQTETITENNANLGLAFLGDAPPTVELHNQMFQWLDEKDNYLFQQIQNAVAERTGVALSEGSVTALRDAIATAATTAKSGIQQNATGPETQAMAAADRTVTPASLKPLIDSLVLGIANSVPSGGVLPFARSSAPAGWLVAGGQAVSRATYVELFNAIGTTFGAGNGTTTFNLPNIQGAVVRGWNGSGSGVDSGRGFGSMQQGQNQQHTHGVTVSSVANHSHTFTTAANGGHTHTNTLAASGSHTHGASSATAGWHAHSASTDAQGSHAHSGSTDAQGVHTHGTPQGSPGGPFNGPYASGDDMTYSVVAYPQSQAAGNHAHNISTNTVGNHAHNVSIAGDGSHTHGITVNAVGNHTHDLTINGVGDHTHSGTTEGAGGHTHTVTIANEGGEARMYNIALLYCIKI